MKKVTINCVESTNTASHPSNILTYMISYMRSRPEGGQDLTYADYVYVSMGRGLAVGLTGWLGGVMANKIGLRPTLAIGMTLYRFLHTCTRCPMNF